MARRRHGRPVHGWVILDKPEGMTSTRAVATVKRLFDAAKAGHGGTLDPLASGCLPIALGEATKTVGHVMDGDKSYRFTLRFGAETTTGDAEGEATRACAVRPSAAQIAAVLDRFTGDIEQVPPAFSALKVGGERAYDLARAGAAVALAPRRVHVARLELDGLAGDEASFTCECGKGTYIRSLGRDIARALGSAGHIVMLRRTRVGRFGEAAMIGLEKLLELSHKDAGCDALTGILQPLETALDDIPALALSEEDAARMRHGQAVHLTCAATGGEAATVLATHRGRALAIARLAGGLLSPMRVFNLDDGTGPEPGRRPPPTRR